MASPIATPALSVPAGHVLVAREHLAHGGVYDAAGRELMHVHHQVALYDLLDALPARTHKLIAAAEEHLDDPTHRVHQDVQDALHAERGGLKGVWHIDRYDAPIEYYAARARLGKGYGQAVSDAELAAVGPFHLLDAATRAAADAMMKRDVRADSSEFEEREFENLFTTQGVSALWNQAANGGTANAGGSAPGVKAWFNNAQAVIGVGDSSTAATNAQFDLQAASNRLWVAMDASYPTLPGTGSNQIVFRSTFGSAQGNYAWAEFAIANDNGSNVTIPGSTARGASNGSMLDRVVSSQGTKASGQTWQPTMTLSIS